MKKANKRTEIQLKRRRDIEASIRRNDALARQKETEFQRRAEELQNARMMAFSRKMKLKKLEKEIEAHNKSEQARKKREEKLLMESRQIRGARLSMGGIVLGCVILIGIGSLSERAGDVNDTTEESIGEAIAFDAEAVPDYAGYAYIEVNDNVPYFSDEEKQTVEAFETYSDLDALGRCGVAYANVCRELQPAEPKGEIGSIRPSGWHTVKYNDIISDNYLYNRCHLLGYQLTGENANEKNLITGTRYMNVAGMLPFENQIAEYLDSYDNHVLYRVTPIFEGDDLVAHGVLMEGYSVEDAGAGICFNVYCYNVQPGIAIDYANGDSHEDPSVVAYDDNYESAIQRDSSENITTESSTEGYAAHDVSGGDVSNDNVVTSPVTETYSNDDPRENSAMVWISETGSKYHRRNNCGNMNPDKSTQITREEAEGRGYSPCGRCY